MPVPSHRSIQTHLEPIPANLRAFFTMADISVKTHGGKGKRAGGGHGGHAAKGHKATLAKAKVAHPKAFHVKVHGRARSEAHMPDPFRRKGVGHG